MNIKYFNRIVRRLVDCVTGRERRRILFLLETLERESQRRETRDRQMFYTVQTLQSEIRSLVRHLSLPDGEWEAGIRAQPSTTPSVDILEKSTVCRQEHFDKPDFAYWIQKLNAGRTYHRKNWEHVYICKALFERNMLRPGMRGLGFAVGRERLPAFFASMGCEIVATDLAADDDRATHWRNAQQYSTAKANLAFPDLVSSAEFERLVSFEAADMNAIPDQLRDFDFCWSACAFEHLGSIEAGLKFVEASIECLKPGGYAVHTTEFNLSSDTDTVDNNHTVLFRRRDMEVLAKRLVARGYRVAPLDFSPGSQPLDRYIYMPPYRQNPHLRLMLMGYVSTSFGMIIQR